MSGAEPVRSRGGPVQVCRKVCNEVCNPITHLSPRTAPPHLGFCSREQTILVERAISLGEEKDTKTAAHRTVRVLHPLAVDLREWRLRSGRPARTR